MNTKNSYVILRNGKYYLLNTYAIYETLCIHTEFNIIRVAFGGNTEDAV